MEKVTSVSQETMFGGHRPRPLRSSMTRLWGPETPTHEVRSLGRSDWSSGDYVVGEVTYTPGLREVELPSGRLVELGEGDLVIGALGARFATLEATGSWEGVRSDGIMEMLGTGGIMGACQSLSTLVPPLPRLRYAGHLWSAGGKLTMQGAAAQSGETRAFSTPTILLTGTSMSAGKTTAGKVVVRRLRNAGLRVVGAKLTGAGRYRDILGLRDAGADAVVDFVDVGLPSTYCSEEAYRPALSRLLSIMAGLEADVVVAEIGASPLEPYNGTSAIEAIRDSVVMNILCASDPYAVSGALSAYDLRPDLVTGPTSNTEAGIQLVSRLTGLHAMDLRKSGFASELDALLASRVSAGDWTHTGTRRPA